MSLRQGFRQYFAIFTCLFLGLCALLLARENALLPDGKTHAYFFDVGQGDSALLVSPSGKTILIDGGPDLSALEPLGRHLSFMQKRIDLLILTHPERDHLAAFPEILRHYHVRALLLTGAEGSEGRYQEILALAHTQNISILLSRPVRDIDFGDGLLLDVLWPPAQLPSVQTNAASLVFRAVTGSSSILFTGDIDRIAEEALLGAGTDVHASILKVPHHGSDTSSTLAFLRAVHPGLAIISVGKDNPYGHPRPETLERYAALNIPVRMTAREGTIALTLAP